MGRQKRPDRRDRRTLAPEGDDSDLAAGFAVGPAGVGPVMGFGSDDFFPVVPVGEVAASEDAPSSSSSSSSSKDEPVRASEPRSLGASEGIVSQPRRRVGRRLQVES